MFFNIGKSHAFNYSHFWQLGDFAISTDAGWRHCEFDTYEAVFKGYCDNSVIDERLLTEFTKTRFPIRTGNFCAILFDRNTGTLSIKTDKYRSFPIYSDRCSRINNLVPDAQTQWSDSVVWIDSDWNIQDAQFDIVGATDLSSGTVDGLDQYLTHKIATYFAHHNTPVKVFLTGGLDTMLIYSYIKKLDAPHVMVDCLHVDFDEFYVRNSADIEAHPFYRQLHHWKTSSVLSSGTPGDEFLLRSPTTAGLYLLNHGVSMLQVLQDHPDCYHHHYFTSDKNLSFFRQQEQEFEASADLIWTICNILANDWQHWHLGNTITWTPLRDLEIAKRILSLPFDLVKSQILHGEISRRLIERNCPGLTQQLGHQKNAGNSWRGLESTMLGSPNL